VDNLNDEELSELCSKHLGWIHAAEIGLNRRLTREEAIIVLEMLYVRGWSTFVEDQANTLQLWQTTQQEMSQAMENLVEGLNSATD
jgi:hypothetical protein